MTKSKNLFSKAKKIIPSGVNSPVRFFKPYPFFVRKSLGSSIWDEDGTTWGFSGGDANDVVNMFWGNGTYGVKFGLNMDGGTDAVVDNPDTTIPSKFL